MANDSAAATTRQCSTRVGSSLQHTRLGDEDHAGSRVAAMTSCAQWHCRRSNPPCCRCVVWAWPQKSHAYTLARERPRAGRPRQQLLGHAICRGPRFSAEGDAL